MTNKPWQETEEFGFSFPFRCWDLVAQDFFYPSHWHECYEIVVVLKGRTTIVIDGDARDAHEGDIVLLDPGRVHGFSSSDAETIVRIFHFAQTFFAKEDHMHVFVDYRSVFTQQPIIRALPDASEENTHQAFYKKMYDSLDLIFDEYKKKDKGWQIAIKSELYRFFLTYVRSNKVDTDKHDEKIFSMTTEERFERVFLFINKHFHNENLDLNKAATEAALSRFHFTRLFKQRTGQNFYDYLSFVRVSHAQ
ncbi:MAG: AraC family transcriptional regulator, partial [Treponema sp.]|nr:AraC family transcriptional regulator [Treponema sp.]